LSSISTQDYPEVEHLVIDGGSVDGSTDILARWKQPVYSWISEPDSGPAEALNKGLRRSSGEIVVCLNAGSVLYPGAISAVVRHFESNPACRALYGRVGDIGEHDTKIIELTAGSWAYNRLQIEGLCRQPGVFWRREAQASFGLFDERLRFAYEYEYWLRMGRMTGLEYFDGPVLGGVQEPAKVARSTLILRYEEYMEAVCRHATSMASMHHWLRVLSHLRATSENAPLTFDNQYDIEHSDVFRTWLLLYADRFQIPLDDSILAECSECGLKIADQPL
jgi:glycosyltransferase involved in cell wall biosynthesis